MNPKARNDERGSVISGVLILLIFSMLVMSLALSLGTVTSLSRIGIAERTLESHLAAWRAAVLRDAVVELGNNTVHETTSAAIARRKGRVSSMLTAAGSTTAVGLEVQSYSVGPFSVEPYSKANALGTVSGLALFHPAGRAPVFALRQEVSGVLDPGGVDAPFNVAASVEYLSFASSDIGLILLDRYDGSSGPVFSVDGTAWLPGGFDALDAPVRLEASAIASAGGSLASGASGKSLAADTIAVHASYTTAWGVAPSELVIPTNLAPRLSHQSFFDRAAVVVHVRAGNAISALPAGLTVEEYPASSGVVRVVADLSVLGATGANVYINLLTATDRANGVAVLGAPTAAPGQHATLATNGTLLLRGQNAMPAVLASIGGEVDCNDLSGRPALEQVWVGSLFLPVATNFNTSQAGAGATLQVRGSVLTGSPAGSLPRLAIIETLEPSVRGDAPRFLTIRAVW